MNTRTHTTMQEAQAECRVLRKKGDTKSMLRAEEIEAQWRDSPGYESDYAWLTRMQAGANYSEH